MVQQGVVTDISIYVIAVHSPNVALVGNLANRYLSATLACTVKTKCNKYKVFF